MTIKKKTSGYEVRFRVNGRGSREHKRVFPTKAECERFQRHTIAQFETRSDEKPWLEKPKDMRRLSELVELCGETLRTIPPSNILTLQKVLGHSDMKMTMRYSHLSPNFLEAKRLNLLSNIK